MKNIFYLFLMCLMTSLIFSCTKDQEGFALDDQITIDVRKPAPKVDVCHFDAETGEYHTINISVNALEAHLAHGDYEGACVDCDPVCVFCPYLEYFDFDEPCDAFGTYDYGDYYCQYEFNYGDTYGCGADNIFGWAELVDHDYGECFPDPEGDYDDGHIMASYYTDGCGYWEGNIHVSYFNEDGTAFTDGFNGFTESAYNQALYCASVIAGLNSALANPLVNVCDNPTKPSSEALKEKWEANKKSIELIAPHRDYPEELKKIIMELQSNKGKIK